jgi:hypothetical protein
MDRTTFIQLLDCYDHIIMITDPVTHISKDTVGNQLWVLYISYMFIAGVDDVVELTITIR